MDNRLERDSKHIEKDLSTPADFTDPDKLYQLLIKRIQTYHPNTDISMIEKAYHVASKAHAGQKRKSGEPYIIHPLCVAIILAELELDKETIVAGILHDVVEDTPMTKEDVAEEFSPEIAELVDGVTKLTQLNISTDKVDLQAENLRKMFLAMAKDIRVILVKLADRLHNIRTLQYMKPEKQIEKARETLDIYSPIAHRLGISKVKIELDDYSLKYLKPDVYNNLKKEMDKRLETHENFIRDIVSEVEQHMKEAGIECEVDGRVKHYFSIYKKMVNQHKTLDQIYDLFAVRIKVNTVKDCYAALGIIHEMYKPIPGRFKDYIAMPKPNMYQSLHTTLISGDGQPFEIQIRTFEMHRIAEYGIAAHWKYKENIIGTTKTQEEEKLSWLRQILEWQRDSDDNKEYLNFIKTDLDLFAEEVYCFTPAGDVKNLPAGSTPVDFAYAIHSSVGNRMVGARVNGEHVPINYTLQNGDRVEIITSNNSAGPSSDWLKFVKSPQAKGKINQWFKHAHKAENIVKGRELLIEQAKQKGLDPAALSQPEYRERVQIKYGFHDWDSVLAAVGRGGLKETQVINRMTEEYKKDHPNVVTDEDILETYDKDHRENAQTVHSTSGVIIKGAPDLPVRFAHCCNPVPGDEIVGFITRGRGVTIHRSDCANLQTMDDTERQRMVEAEWASMEQSQNGEKFEAELNIYTTGEKGTLMQITKLFSEMNINILNMEARSAKNGQATVTVSFETSGTEEMKVLVNKLRALEFVRDIERKVS